MKKWLTKSIGILGVSIFIGWFSLLFAMNEVPIPSLTNYVVDSTNTLSQQEQSLLNTRLKSFQEETGSQIFVLIVPTVQPETIETYAVRVFEAWKVGRKKMDDGVLFVIAKNDRRNRIEVGYGLEGAIPDVVASRILKQDVAPYFQQGDFVGGINIATIQLMRLIKKENLPSSTKMNTELESWEEYIPLVMGGIVALVIHPLFGAIIFVGMGYPVLAAIIFMIALIIRRLFRLPLFSVGTPTGHGRFSPRRGWDNLGGRDRGGFGGGFGGGGGGSSGGGGASGRW